MSETINLIQIDWKMPNLALMKLAAYHRKKGDNVRFIDLSNLKADRWYGSKIFMGGSGYNIKETLPKDIEAEVPDYELFQTDYSIGFTSRGCINDCGFCIVKEKEGSFYDCDFSEHIKHSQYIIMDNNFLASKIWKQKLQYFIDNDIKVNFNQGLDIRTMTTEKAEMLSRVKYYDRTFSRRNIYFAFDNPKDEKRFRKGLETLLKHIKPKHVVVYMLVGYGTTHEEDMHRHKLIDSYDCDPYVMIYNKRKDMKLRHFQRWVNTRVYRVCSWEDYDISARGKNGVQKP